MTIRRTSRFLASAALVLAIWTAILGLLAFASEPGAPLAVFAPGHAKDIAVEAGGSLEGFGENIAVTRSTEPGLTLRLYKSGALFVVDARVVMSCRSWF
jgi:hypothetical protein